MTDHSQVPHIQVPHRHIAVCGTIGVGKSTLAEALAATLGYRFVPEASGENTIWPFFYADPPRGAFLMQTFMASAKVAAINAEDPTDPLPMVVDRSLEEDAMFARVMHDTNLLNDVEWGVYQQLMTQWKTQVPAVDAVVFLKVRPEVALQRIRQRGRPYEQNIDLEYLLTLDQAYERLKADYQRQNVVWVELDWNELQPVTQVHAALLGHQSPMVPKEICRII